MMVQDNYRWEAEKEDGALMTAGGDLSGCVRFSLIPDMIGLPAHDIVGVPMKRRFCRAFHRTAFQTSSMLPGFLSWENGSPVVGTSEDLTGLVSTGDRIRKRHDGEEWWIVLSVTPTEVRLFAPYTGTTKRIESRRFIPPPRSEYLHCIVCRGYRLYIKSTDGGVIITPETYELYL